MERILQVVTYMGRGGIETMLMNHYRSLDRTKIQFDFWCIGIFGRILMMKSKHWADEFIESRL